MNKFFIVIFLFALSSQLWAQSPQSFQYQAVVRDASGTALVNQTVNFQISIISGSITGTVEYKETHTATTNAYGIVSLSIGSGIPLTGNFSGITWENNMHFVKVEADPSGGTSFLDMGTTQLLSVPYALYAEKAGNIQVYNGGTGIDVTGTTITNLSPDQVLSITSGTGVSVTGTYPNFTIDNTSPDQQVTLTGAGATNVSGTYPNFTINSSDLNTGTPGGLNKTIQYNNNGIFAGDTAALVWDNSNGRLGIGSSNPTGRVVIKGSASAPDSVPLFEIKNSSGQQIMAVYNDSIHFFITDIGANRGGFAVSGRNAAKALTNDFLRINADSTRIYTTDTIMGFGVKNIGPTSKTSYMKLTPGNYFIGHKAGDSITTGLYNIFFGYNAGISTKTGNNNLFSGYKSGYKNSSGSNNVFMGNMAGYNNTTAFNNTAIGLYAMQSNTIGYENTAVGNSALKNNTTGLRNAALGNEALYNNNIGGYNVAIGHQALYSNIDGYYNVATGYKALYINNAGYNVANGYQALFLNSAGEYNVATGYQALYNNIDGNQNIATGYKALKYNTSGIRNIAVGYEALISNTTGQNNTAIGTWVMMFNSSGFDNAAMGGYALSNNTTGNYNTAIGTSAMYSNQDGSMNVGVGYYAMLNNSGTNNTSLGTLSMNQVASGDYNVAVGRSSMDGIVNANYNTSIGSNTYFNGDWTNSTAVGYGANITASDQVRIGNTSVSSIGGQVGWTTLSDKRFKKDISASVPGLNFIMKLNPVTYRVDVKTMFDYLNIPDSITNLYKRNKTELLQTGFLAQDVESAAKEIGFEFSGIDKPKNDKDYYGLRYSEFTVPLVKAVQEQQIMIEELKGENIELKKINDELLDRISKIENQLNK